MVYDWSTTLPWWASKHWFKTRKNDGNNQHIYITIYIYVHDFHGINTNKNQNLICPGMVDTPVCGSSIPIFKQTYLGKMEDWLDENQRGWWPKSSFLAHNTTPKLTQDTISAKRCTKWILKYPSSPIIIRSWYTPFVSLIYVFACQSFWHDCQFEQIAQFRATDMLILLVINLIISHHITPCYPHEMIGFILPKIQKFKWLFLNQHDSRFFISLWWLDPHIFRFRTKGTLSHAPPAHRHVPPAPILRHPLAASPKARNRLASWSICLSKSYL